LLFIPRWLCFYLFSAFPQIDTIGKDIAKQKKNCTSSRMEALHIPLRNSYLASEPKRPLMRRLF